MKERYFFIGNMKMETTYRKQLLAFDEKLRELTACPKFTFTHFYYRQLMEPFLTTGESTTSEERSDAKINPLLTTGDAKINPLLTTGDAKINPFIRNIEDEEVIDLVVELAAIKKKTITKIFAHDCLQEAFESMSRVGEQTTRVITSLPISNAMRTKLRHRYSGKDFEHDLWRMLYRYETLALVANENMQLSIPDKEYEKLAKNGYEYECFASPLNCHLKYFFSAFPDTDSVFGSLGSFFQNYEKIPANAKCTLDPPYQLHLMEKAISIAFKHPATFRVVVVAWKDTTYYKELREKSDAFIEYPKSEKSFILHQANGQRFIKPSDTVIAIIHSRK